MGYESQIEETNRCIINKVTLTRPSDASDEEKLLSTQTMISFSFYLDLDELQAKDL